VRGLVGKRRRGDTASARWSQRYCQTETTPAPELCPQILGPVGLDDRVNCNSFAVALALLVANAILSFFQKQRASAAVAALRKRLQVMG
jgi:hypothetical protein